MIRAAVREFLRVCPIIYRPSILTRNTIRWAYRLFLDREPESSHVLTERLKGPIKTIQDLRSDMLLSKEFALKNVDLATFPANSIVIKELSCGRRLYVDLGDNVIGCQVVRDQYEPHSVEILPRFVSPGSTVLDIGANIGFFTMHLADLVGETGRVFAFEPIKELAALVERSIAENQFQERVVLENAAIGDHSGNTKILFIENARNHGASFLVEDSESESEGAHQLRDVPMIALDDYPLEDRVSFIKMDIEGAEPMCIRGCTSLLKRDRPVVMSEIHPQQLSKVSQASPRDYITLFSDLDYLCYGESGESFNLLDANHPIDELITVFFVPRENTSAQEILCKAASKVWP